MAFIRRHLIAIAAIRVLFYAGMLVAGPLGLCCEETMPAPATASEMADCEQHMHHEAPSTPVDCHLKSGCAPLEQWLDPALSGPALVAADSVAVDLGNGDGIVPIAEQLISRSTPPASPPPRA